MSYLPDSYQVRSGPGVSVFSPPWRDMTDSYYSLQEIQIMFFLPDSFKVRSGPGVTVIKKFQITNNKQITMTDPPEADQTIGV